MPAEGCYIWQYIPWQSVRKRHGAYQGPLLRLYVFFFFFFGEDTIRTINADDLASEVIPASILIHLATASGRNAWQMFVQSSTASSTVSLIIEDVPPASMVRRQTFKFRI